ncbi:MAG: hypothetical protein DRQ99_15740 [Candidatus Parabeggiatoa sp. nov. 3]|nr:MAG: hypothetical protein DRQ99_15740 [Gammaproteobacteria bacterium]
MGKRKSKRVLAPKSKPLSNKNPRQTSSLDSDLKKPAWQFNEIDWAGPWGWHQLAAQKWQEILTKLGYFETRTWADIKSDGNNHAVDIQNTPNPEVLKRLAEIHQDDIDELFSLRLSGKERLWGILDNHILKILWWDANHDVWPSKKKHT